LAKADVFSGMGVTQAIVPANLRGRQDCLPHGSCAENSARYISHELILARDLGGRR
jgi:hypothetical protein